jgi:hypothetical protein
VHAPIGTREKESDSICREKISTMPGGPKPIPLIYLHSLTEARDTSYRLISLSQGKEAASPQGVAKDQSKGSIQMMRNLKVLGVALAAVFAMSAIAASMASADTITAEKYPVTLTGSQSAPFNNVLTVPNTGTVKCETATYHGELTAAGTTVTITPTYKKCEVLGFASGEAVNMNGCDYMLHLNPAAGNTTGTADVVCPAGKEIVVTATSVGTTKCVFNIPAQVGLAKATVTNTGAGTTSELVLHLEVKNIKETHTAGTGLGKCTAGGASTAELGGTVNVTGEETASPFNHIGIFLS